MTLGLVLAERTDARQSPTSPRGHAVLAGLADAVDGDTLLVGDVRVRLEGIDAPVAEQTCTTVRGSEWPCGLEARRLLARLVEGQSVACEERGLDTYKRLLAVCRTSQTELNAEMVRRGLAWAFVRYSQSYVAIEAIARTRRIGIWSGVAQPAWEYRSARWQSAETIAPSGCPIKGNVTANGRIYHLPWSPWYGRVKMDGKGKRWFCSEAEAIAAGWRPANAH
ncbi:MAG: thermonuclease family protein [Hyphomicrobiaceae bacterium]|nr:thermonuclease family protein [Hyphomicrobiaceae bacterium]